MQPPASRKALGAAARQTLRRVGDGRMARALVTGLAQKRCAHLEQSRLHRTVRLVAAGAVLGHRLVFPEKRPAVFGVAAGAGFIDGVLHQLGGRRRAMRRMAGGARHLSFAHRMMRGFEKGRCAGPDDRWCRLRSAWPRSASDLWACAAHGNSRRPHRLRHARSRPNRAPRSIDGSPGIRRSAGAPG